MQQEMDIQTPTEMDHVREDLQDRLSEREYERLERMLQLIERNRKINSAFHKMRRQGYKVHEAVIKLAKTKWCGQYLSEAWIEEIIYPRQ